MELSCTRCGGGLPSLAVREPVACPYCGMISVPPPAVVERVVEHVVERVVMAVLPGAAEPARLRCPRCARGLTDQRVGENLLAGCGTCGGLWLDASSVARLMKAHDEDLELAARRINGGPVIRRLEPRNRQAQISCPVCSAPLRRVEFPDTENSIDVCDAHGTWFDRDHGDELKMFVTAFEDARAGVVTDDDLRSAGVPGRGVKTGGLFTWLFGTRR